jgi:hypothetical protein
MQWARYSKNNYEVSSKGDRRFSALFANFSKIDDPQTIEEIYQLDVKGYREHGDNWRLGKGKAPINGLTREEAGEEYFKLWELWAELNPELIEELIELSKDKILTDQFATSEVNQAHALARILSEKENNGFSF